MGASQSRWARHLEGWELGLLAVAVALVAVWLGLPRPVEPRTFPLPNVDRRVILRGRAVDLERAARAASGALPFEVRALGEHVRRHGAAVVRADAVSASEARDAARRLSRSLEQRGSGELVQQLRAAQSALFMQAVERFRQSGRADRELDELGANFVEKCRSAGWLDADNHLLLAEGDLLALYRVRWAELTGTLELGSLRPNLDEFRLYYRVLLEHPEGQSPPEQDERRLAYVSALGRIDQEFPSDVARGVLLFRLGRPQAAYMAFSAHAAAHEDGPWALSARNYALSALAQVQAAE
ncbi:MAG: hypothetical protein QM756_28895 [Polyangiaceae bacterium]